MLTAKPESDVHWRSASNKTVSGKLLKGEEVGTGDASRVAVKSGAVSQYFNVVLAIDDKLLLWFLHGAVAFKKFSPCGRKVVENAILKDILGLAAATVTTEMYYVLTGEARLLIVIPRSGRIVIPDRMLMRRALRTSFSEIAIAREFWPVPRNI